MSLSFDAAVNYVMHSLLATSQQLALMLGPALLYGWLMNYVSGFVERRAVALMGPTLYLWLFAWLGTAVHELGHALFCVLFRHRINELVLFRPDPETGTLGYVNHGYNPDSAYQRIGNFFIGIGPIVLGSALLYLSAVYLLDHGVLGTQRWLPPPTDGTAVWSYALEGLRSSVAGAKDALGMLLNRDHLVDWRFYLFLYIALSVGSSIKLSPADIQGAAGGFGALLITAVLVNLATLWILEDWVYSAIRSVSHFYTGFYSVIVFGIVVNGIAAIALLIGSIILRPFIHRRDW